MAGWNASDIAIIGVAAYFAATALVRLMNRRQDGIIEELERQAAAERQLKRRNEQRKKRKWIRKQLQREPSDGGEGQRR